MWGAEEMWPETFPFREESWRELGAYGVLVRVLCGACDILPKPRDLLIGDIAGVHCPMLGHCPPICVDSDTTG